MPVLLTAPLVAPVPVAVPSPVTPMISATMPRRTIVSGRPSARAGHSRFCDSRRSEGSQSGTNQPSPGHSRLHVAAILAAPRLLVSPLVGRPMYWNVKKCLQRRARP